MTDIGYWYCCLNQRERLVLHSTAIGLVDTLFVGIPLPIWDLFWLTFSPNGGALRVAFLHLYSLEIVEIMLGEPPVPVEVVRPVNLPFWVEWSLFILTPPAACVGGCTQSTVGE